ncbi:MAG TPA: F0F1 ATP synthase subunit B [Tepidisphaeraceae bacterium]|nr:F0F1 ATP synthase subunit B [Tepidisphaeraceae bacterium]
MFKRIVLSLALMLALLSPVVRAASEAAEESEPKASIVPDMTSKDTYYSAMWVIIIFIIMLAVLYPTAWRNVLEGLKKREQRIRGDIADAEAARVKAEGTLKDYTAQLASAEAKTREMISAAATQGEKLATQIRMQAQQEAEQIKERATKEIEAARDAAVREVYDQAANLSTMIAEKIIRRNLNAADQQDLVAESLKQLETVNT